MTLQIPLYDNLPNEMKELVDAHLLYSFIEDDARFNQQLLIYEFHWELTIFQYSKRPNYYQWIQKWMTRRRWNTDIPSIKTLTNNILTGFLEKHPHLTHIVH
jgi:hypothetical protein